jgi:hypothetical protein
MLGKDLFITPVIEERPVALPGGTQKLHFRKVSSFDWERFVECLRSRDPDQRAVATHVLIAASLCEADGSDAITIEKAKALLPDVAASIYIHALDMNRKKKAEETEEGAPGNV